MPYTAFAHALRQNALQPLRAQRAEIAGDIARLVAQFRLRQVPRFDARDMPAGVRSRRHAFRSRQQLWATAGLGRACLRRHPARRLPRLSRRTRDLHQGRLRHVAGALRRMGQPQIPACEPRPESQAHGPRLRRHLLLAPLRSRNAARGDDGRSRSCGSPGEGALRRHFLLQFPPHQGGGRHPQAARRRRASSISPVIR